MQADLSREQDVNNDVITKHKYCVVVVVVVVLFPCLKITWYHSFKLFNSFITEIPHSDYGYY